MNMKKKKLKRFQYLNILLSYTIIIIIIIYCSGFLTLQVLKLINYCASHNLFIYFVLWLNLIFLKL